MFNVLEAAMNSWLKIATSRLCAASPLLLLIAISGPRLHAEQLRPCAELDPRDGLRIAAGPAGGAYESLGTAVAQEAKTAGLPLQLCSSQGSIENIALLSEGKAEFGFVQSDNMLDYWFHAARPNVPNDMHATGIGVKPKEISLVSRLYSERLHLLIGEDSAIYSIANLKGKNIWLGPEGSGSRNLALQVLRAAGFDDSEIYRMDNCKTCTLKKALSDLSSGRLSAVFRTTSVPLGDRTGSPISYSGCNASAMGLIASTLCENPEVRLFSLDETLLGNLTRNPRYCESLIPRQAYPNQNYAVATIGVQALLVTTMPSADISVRSLYGVLSTKKPFIEDRIGSRLDLLSEKLDGVAMEELSPHVHEQVKHKLLRSRSETLRQRVAVILTVIFLLWLLLRPGAASKSYEARVRFGVCLILIILLWFSLGYALYRTEGQFNLDYSTPWNASWSVLTHYSHGLQTPAMTPAGREIAFLGLGAFVLFVGWLRSALIDDFLDRSATGLARICARVQASIRNSLENWITSDFPIPRRRRTVHNAIALKFHNKSSTREVAGRTQEIDGTGTIGIGSQMP